MESFYEIETTCKRAAKASGFSWGIAEEIGKIVRSLEIMGLPGLKTFYHYLDDVKMKLYLNQLKFYLKIQITIKCIVLLKVQLLF